MNKQNNTFDRIFDQYVNLRRTQTQTQNNYNYDLPPELDEGFSELSLEVDDFSQVKKQTIGQSKIANIVNDENFNKAQSQNEKAQENQESQDQDYALKMVGLSTPKQDLTNLQLVCPPSISLIEDENESGKDEDFNKNFKSLISILAENKLRETWQKNIQKKTLQFYPESDFSKYIEPIIADLTVLLQKLNNDINQNDVDCNLEQDLRPTEHESMINTYIKMSYNCKLLQTQNVREQKYTKLHRMLDIFLQKHSKRTKSASQLIQFALFTGNVSYLLQAINMLLSQNEKNSLRSDELAPFSNFQALQNEKRGIADLVCQVGNSKVFLLPNTINFCHFDKSCFIYNQQLHQIEKFNLKIDQDSQKKNWVKDESFVFQLSDEFYVNKEKPQISLILFPNNGDNQPIYQYLAIDMKGSVCEKLIGNDFQNEKERNTNFIKESLEHRFNISTVKIFCWRGKVYSVIVTFDKASNSSLIITFEKGSKVRFELTVSKQITMFHVIQYEETLNKQPLYCFKYQGNQGSEEFRRIQLFVGQCYEGQIKKQFTQPIFYDSFKYCQNVDSFDQIFKKDDKNIIVADSYLYLLERVDYPLNSQTIIEKANQEQEQELVNDFLDLPNQQTVKSSKDSNQRSSMIWVFYITKVIQSFSDYQRKEIYSHNRICYVQWMRTYPNKFYFEQIFTLLKQDQGQQIIKRLKNNIADNLNICTMLGVKLDQMFRDNPNENYVFENIKFHLSIQPELYLRYCQHSEKLMQEITNVNLSKSECKLIIQYDQEGKPCAPQYLINIQMRAVCVDIINGNFGYFFQLLENLQNQKRYQQLYTLLTCLFCKSIKNLPQKMIHNLLKLRQDLNLPKVIRDQSNQLFLKLIEGYLSSNTQVQEVQQEEYNGFLITQSELLSGGISNSEITLFSQETKEQIQVCSQLMNDSDIQLQDQNQSSNENIYFDIINGESNWMVDDIIQVLQNEQIKQGGQIKMLSMAGKEIGMKLVRCAFAVMIKLNKKLSTIFNNIIQEIELQIDHNSDQTVRLDSINKIQPKLTELESLKIVWKKATQMRQWLQAKKQSIQKKYEIKKEGQTDDQRDELERNHLDDIIFKIIEKAKFLVKLEASKTTVVQEKLQSLGRVYSRKPSYIRQKSISNVEFEPVNEFNNENIAKLNQDKLEALQLSVLSCLQAPVLCSEIQNQVEINYLAGLRRYSGLYILNNILQEDNQLYLIVGKCLIRFKENNNISHFLDGISGGCNQQIESKIRQVMFHLMQKITKRLSQSNDVQEANILLSVMNWQYQARDFQLLQQKFNHFEILTTSSGAEDSLIAQSWGRIDTKFEKFRKQLMQAFTNAFITILKRITDQRTMEDMKLKNHGDNGIQQIIPNLQKVKSVLDEFSSSQLVQQGVKPIFKLFNEFIIQKSVLDQINDQQTLTKFQDLSYSDKFNYLQQVLDKKELLVSQIQADRNNDFDFNSNEFERIQLKYQEFVPCHEHILTRSIIGGTRRWKCDSHTIPGRGQCISQITQFQNTVQGWFCRQCSFDLCVLCMKVEKFAEQKQILENCDKNFDWKFFMMQSNSQQFQNLPRNQYQHIVLTNYEVGDTHSCVLEKNRNFQTQTSWRCNSPFCRSGITNYNSRGIERWRCNNCDFDLCIECMKIDKRIKIQIEEFQQSEISLLFLDKTRQVKYAPYTLYNKIIVDSTVKIQTHHHPLTKQITQPSSWNCDKIAGSNFCIKFNLNRQSTDTHWGCRNCNFDLCLDCVQIEIWLKNQQEIQNLKVKQSGKIPNSEYEKHIQAKEQFIQTFITRTEHQSLDQLIRLIRLFCSVSQESQISAKILQTIVNQNFIITLIKLLIIVSNRNKKIILDIVIDLVKLKIPFELSNQVTNRVQDFKIKDFKLGSNLLNLLFSAAKYFAVQGNADAVKFVIKTMQSFQIDFNNQELIQNLNTLDTTEQVLTLMLCNCGAEIKRPVLGDKMIQINSNIGIEEKLILQDFNDKSVTLFSQDQQKFVTRKRSQLLLKKSQNQNNFMPQQHQILEMLKSNETNIVVKIMLLNMLIENKSEYKVLRSELQTYISNYLSKEFDENEDWISKQCELSTTSLVTNEMEEQLSQEMFSQNLLQLYSKQDILKPRRNLVKKFFGAKSYILPIASKNEVAQTPSNIFGDTSSLFGNSGSLSSPSIFNNLQNEIQTQTNTQSSIFSSLNQNSSSLSNQSPTLGNIFNSGNQPQPVNNVPQPQNINAYIPVVQSDQLQGLSQRLNEQVNSSSSMFANTRSLFGSNTSSQQQLPSLFGQPLTNPIQDLPITQQQSLQGGISNANNNRPSLFISSGPGLFQPPNQTSQNQNQNIVRPLNLKTNFRDQNLQLLCRPLFTYVPESSNVPKTNLNFVFLFQKELRAEQPPKPKNLKIISTNVQVLFQQRATEFLFQSYEEGQDINPNILWKLNKFYLHKKVYNQLKGIHKQGITQQWVKILQNQSDSFQNGYVKTRLLMLTNFCQSKQTLYQLKQTYFDIVNMTKIICKIIQYDQTKQMYKQYANEIVDLILLLINQWQFNLQGDILASFQKLTRSSLAQIQLLINLALKNNDVETFTKICGNQYLQQFITTANNIELKYQNDKVNLNPIHHFIYVAKQIQFTLTKTQMQLKKSNYGQSILLNESLKTKNSQISKLIQFDSTLSKYFNTDEHQLSSEEIIVEWPDNIHTINQDELSNWKQIDLQNTNQNIKVTKQTLKIRKSTTNGISVVCVSNKPEFNCDSVYKLLDTEITIDISGLTNMYLNFCLKEHFIVFQDQKLQINNLLIVPNCISLFGIQDLNLIFVHQFQNEILYFITNIGGTELYITDPNKKMQFEKVNGLTGSVKSIEFSSDLKKFIIYNDANNAFTFTQNPINQSSLDQISFFKDKDGNKITFYLISHETASEQFKGYGYTQNFQLVIISGQVFKDTIVQLKFIYGITETVFEGNFFMPTQDCIVKAPYFQIILHSVVAQKVDNNDTAADLIIFNEQDKQFYAFLGQNLFQISEGIKLPIQIELPSKFLRCDNFIKTINNNLILEVTENDDSKQLYFCSFEIESEEKLVKRKIRKSVKVKHYNQQVLKLILKKNLGENQFVNIFSTKLNQITTTFAIDKQAQLFTFNSFNNQFEKANTSQSFKVVQIKNNEKIQTLVIQTDDPQNPIVILGFHSAFIQKNYPKYGLNSTYLDSEIAVHLIDPKIQSLNNIEYAVIQTEEQLTDSQKTEISKDIEQCIEKLNSLLKKFKFSKLKRSLFKKQQKLSDIIIIKEQDFGQTELIKQIIEANQFLFDVKEYVLARSLDQNYYSLIEYKIFAEKFGLPYFLYFLQYLVQKTCRKQDLRNQEKFKFDRLNSDVSLFEQLYKQAAGKSIKLFTESFERPFQAIFIGEGSIDAGGPFREIIENISTEITDIYFKPTSNMQILNESSGYQPTIFNSVQDLKRFQFIGKMIGWSLNSTVYNLSLDLNVIFWKRLCQIPIKMEDINSVDKQRYETVQKILVGEQQSNFEADLGNGEITELCEGGSQIEVTEFNKEKFAELYLKKYLEQDELVSQTIIKGIRQTANPLVLGYLTPTSGPVTAFSTPKLHPEVLNSQIKIDVSSREGSKVLANFQQMVREFTNEERQALVKFITGSSRLGPSRVIRLNLQHYGSSQNIDQNFPVAHTCGESCDIWNYSTLQIMKEKFRIAISTCGEIDGDGDANRNDDAVLNNNNSSNNIIQDDFVDSEQEQLIDIVSDQDELRINTQNPAISNQIISIYGQILINRDTVYNDCYSNRDNEASD